MPRQTRRVTLPSSSPASIRQVMFYDYGPPDRDWAEARPRVYLQAAMHADEIPGLLVQHHLVRLLDEADAAGRIEGRITLAPYANPIGLDQWIGTRHSGRYQLAGGGNFNRNWPDLFETVAGSVDGELGTDADANVAAIRAALRKAVDEIAPKDELGALRKTLFAEAVQADIVLDLHCDDDSLLYLFLMAPHWPAGEDLARELGCEAVLLSDNSGGNCFDESLVLPWLRLAARFPENPVPPACMASTVELRGQADVSDEMAEADAHALFRFLQRRGIVAGDPGPLPEARCEATRLEACDDIAAPAAGVLAYHAALGERVKEGQLIADLIDPTAEIPAEGRRPIRSGTDGLVITRQLHKYVSPGESVAKVAGSRPLPHRRPGDLMGD